MSGFIFLDSGLLNPIDRTRVLSIGRDTADYRNKLIMVSLTEPQFEAVPVRFNIPNIVGHRFPLTLKGGGTIALVPSVSDLVFAELTTELIGEAGLVYIERKQRGNDWIVELSTEDGEILSFDGGLIWLNGSIQTGDLLAIFSVDRPDPEQPAGVHAFSLSRAFEPACVSSFINGTLRTYLRHTPWSPLRKSAI
jgi:hypothetical protein